MATDEYLLSILDKVETFGWGLAHIGEGCSCDECVDEPPFTYTVGLTTMDHPELLVHGLTGSVAARLLNDLGSRIEGGESFSDGQAETCEHGVSMMFGEVLDPSDLVVVGQVYPEFQALQVVWQDWRQRYPWDPGYNHWRFPQLLRCAPRGVSVGGR